MGRWFLEAVSGAVPICVLRRLQNHSVRAKIDKVAEIPLFSAFYKKVPVCLEIILAKMLYLR